MVWISRSQPHARTIRQPQSFAFGLLLQYFQPFLTPKPLDPLVIHRPARPAQEGGHPAVAVPALVTRQHEQPAN
jgi:hypothetical protein